MALEVAAVKKLRIAALAVIALLTVPVTNYIFELRGRSAANEYAIELTINRAHIAEAELTALNNRAEVIMAGGEELSLEELERLYDANEKVLAAWTDVMRAIGAEASRLRASR